MVTKRGMTIGTFTIPTSKDLPRSTSLLTNHGRSGYAMWSVVEIHHGE
jgi:hypothetical protein